MKHGPSQRPSSTLKGTGQPNNEEPLGSRVQWLQPPTTDANHIFWHEGGIRIKKSMGITSGDTMNGVFSEPEVTVDAYWQGLSSNQALSHLEIHV